MSGEKMFDGMLSIKKPQKDDKDAAKPAPELVPEDDYPTMLSVRVPKWMRQTLRKHSFESEEDLQHIVQKLIYNYLQEIGKLPEGR